jgi:hypothetical protein
MLLLKPQVYRHLLFNRISQTGSGIEVSVVCYTVRCNVYPPLLSSQILSGLLSCLSCLKSVCIICTHEVIPCSWSLHVFSFSADIKWFRLERCCTLYDSIFIQKPLYYQYLYILALCILGKTTAKAICIELLLWLCVEFVVFHCFICLTLKLYFRNHDRVIR